MFCINCRAIIKSTNFCIESLTDSFLNYLQHLNHILTCEVCLLATVWDGPQLFQHIRQCLTGARFIPIG